MKGHHTTYEIFQNGAENCLEASYSCVNVNSFPLNLGFGFYPIILPFWYSVKKKTKQFWISSTSYAVQFSSICMHPTFQSLKSRLLKDILISIYCLLKIEAIYRSYSCVHTNNNCTVFIYLYAFIPVTKIQIT